MATFGLSVIVGLVLLIWSAGKFVDGASGVARYYGMPPLLIGMVIIGFGTSAPEMVVSAMSSYSGNPGIALGNAYGSNITNISLILGITTLIFPIIVHSQVLRKELPLLGGATLLSGLLVLDEDLSRFDSFILLTTFILLMIWSFKEGITEKKDTLGKEVSEELKSRSISVQKSFIYLFVGLIVLVASSHLLVFGATGIAMAFGVSDIIVGLTVIAVGTSLPELASSVVAAKKGEPDIALGNVIGSNLFNTLAVVGIAGIINPTEVEETVFQRDILTMGVLTFSLFIFGYGFKKKGRINRLEGMILFISYIVYISYLVQGGK